MKTIVPKGEITEIKEIEKPSLKGKGAIVKILYCGLCGSDIVKLNHQKKDILLGHEIAGEITEINSDTNFKVGDLITAGHHVPCYECDFCKHKSYSMCKKFKTTNFYPGGFSEYIFLSEDHLKNTTFKFTTKPEIATFTEPLACCLRAVKRADIKNNDKVLIVGLGTIGILMGQSAKVFGGKVFGTDLIDYRKNLALEKNFDCILNDEEELFDVIFMTSGAEKAIDTALKHIKNGGKIVVFSSIKSDIAGYPNNDIYYKELEIISSYSSTPEDLKLANELLEQNKVNVEGLWTIYEPEKLNEGLEATKNGKIMKAVVKL